MKYLIRCCLYSVLLSSGLALANPPERRKMQMSEAATSTQLSQTARTAKQTDPILQLGEAVWKTDVDPAKAEYSRDIIKDSTILCFQGNLTLVPKQAVLFVPDALVSRVGAQAGAKVLTWPEFRNANRGWVRSIEVTREQATGVEPLSEDVLKTMAKSTSIVVATFKDGPISVLPPQTADETNRSLPEEKVPNQ